MFGGKSKRYILNVSYWLCQIQMEFKFDVTVVFYVVDIFTTCLTIGNNPLKRVARQKNLHAML